MVKGSPKKRLVVHLSTVHSWKDPRIFLKECITLSNAGYEVHLITKDGTDQIEEGVFVHKLNKIYKNPFIRMFLGVNNAWKQALSLKPDIIHFHDPELLRKAFIYKNEVEHIIYDVHEDNMTAIDQRPYIPRFLRKTLKRIVGRYENKARRELQTIIAEDYYSERFPEAEKVLNYPIIKKSDLNNISLKPPKKKLLYTGSITEDRGALIYRDIQHNLPDFEVSLIGKCNPSLVDKLTTKGNDYTGMLREGVQHYVRHSKIKEYYLQGDWLAGLAIFPPNDHFKKKHLTKFYEYMLYGLPIIYSNFPEWKNLLDPIEVGFSVDPDDISDIISKINQLSENVSMWEKFSENGFKVSRTKFNWQTEEKVLLNLYADFD